jgi:arylsulfatase
MTDNFKYLRIPNGIMAVIAAGCHLKVFKTFRRLFLLILFSLSQPSLASRPNFLLIVADDLGFTDLGAYGSEIHTPHLDQLASSGLLLTDFHSSPACSPTRAMLLTGVDHHLAGLGTMAGEWGENQVGKPGYEGFLNFKVVTVANLLRDSGYHTYMTGKWHLGMMEETGPQNRGFESSFALMQGGASHFFDATGLVSSVPKATYLENGRPISLKADFYSSDCYTDTLMEYIETNRHDGRPFFAYLSFTAPHWPLQAPDSFLAKQTGKYDAGYDELRNQRIKKAAALGVIQENTTIYPRPEGVTAWNDLSLEEQRMESRKMEIYAAMVENLDFNVGRILDYLDHHNLRKNTLVFFLSDNGPEGNDINNLSDNRDWIPKRFNNKFENMGRINSYLFLGPGWAQASSGPFARFKSFPSEGGIRVPAIVNWSGLQEGLRKSGTFSTVMDVAPTLLELAGIIHPGTSYRDKEIYSMQGTSMADFLRGASSTVHGPNLRSGSELFGRISFREGKWKILRLKPPWGTGSWELFNLESDPGETMDLSNENPEKMKYLIYLWEQYQELNQVILPIRDTGYANPKE